MLFLPIKLWPKIFFIFHKFLDTLYFVIKKICKSILTIVWLSEQVHIVNITLFHEIISFVAIRYTSRQDICSDGCSDEFKEYNTGRL